MYYSDTYEMPVDKTGMVSYTTFSWMTNLMWKAYKHGLKQEDVPLCSKYDMSDYNSQRWICYENAIIVLHVFLWNLMILFSPAWIILDANSCNSLTSEYGSSKENIADIFIMFISLIFFNCIYEKWISIIKISRLEELWNEELRSKGADKASLQRVAWRFIRTRVYFGLFLFIFTLLLGFAGPVSL